MVERHCPDAGTCHHGCGERGCFRVTHCGPLSGVYQGDEWPEAIKAVEAARDARPGYTLEGDVFKGELQDPEFARAVGEILSTARQCRTPQELQGVMLAHHGFSLGNTDARKIMDLVSRLNRGAR